MASASNSGWQFNIFFGWLLAFAPLAAFSRHKLTQLEWIWFLGLGWLALSGIRYMIWFIFLLALFTAKLLAEWSNQKIDAPERKINAPVNYSLSIVLILMPLMILPGLRESWWRMARRCMNLPQPPSARWTGSPRMTSCPARSGMIMPSAPISNLHCPHAPHGSTRACTATRPNNG